MANAVIEIPNLPSGQTLTADLVGLASDTVVESAAALTERTNAKTRYRWTHTGEGTGWHAIVVKLGSTVVGGFVVNLANEDGTYYAGDAQAVNWAAILNADEEVDLTGTSIAGLTSGSGPRVITITVDDGSDPVVNAKVVAYVNDYQVAQGFTNGSGVATLNLNDGAHEIAIALAGHSFNGATLTVAGNASVTYSMTAIALEASEPSKTTGWLYAYDQDGAIWPGAVVEIETVRSRLASGAFGGATRSATADETGLVQFPNLFPGNSYRIRIDSGQWFPVDIPSDADESVNIGPAIGANE